MRREFEFVQNLNSNDVDYVESKKKELAVIAVQRQWRKIRGARQVRERLKHNFESNVK